MATITFLFADIERSTELVRRHQQGYVELLTAARAHVRAALEARGGRDIETQGDGLFAVFESARNGVLAAIEAQRTLQSHPWPADGEVRMRMGLHTAEPLTWDEGYA